MSDYLDTIAIHLTPSRLTWIKLNRILAWAMIASPLIQLVFQMNLGIGLQIDLCLLLAHGGLSMTLFGMPKIKGRDFVVSMHVFGNRPTQLSARNRFLLTGYRIALGMTPMLVSAMGFPWYVSLPFLYPILRMPVSVIQHVNTAAQYATRRKGLHEAYGDVVLILYLFGTFINFFQGLLRR